MYKIRFLFPFMMMLALATAVSGCRRNGDEVWEDTKSASRHVNRGVSSLAGKHGDSRAIRCKEDFYPVQDCYSGGQDFIPLPDFQGSDEIAMADYKAQPRETPGDPGSSIPGIDSFVDPATNPQLARVFKPVRFEYNSTLIKDPTDVQTLQNVASYLKSHPKTYIFVEGHCDERGAQAYNLALGSRRSNGVRSQLLADGVNSDQIFTISYGKERPCVFEHHEEAYAANRRAEFKVYQR